MGAVAAALAMSLSAPTGAVESLPRDQSDGTGGARAALRNLRAEAGDALVAGGDAQGDVRLLGSRIGRPLARPHASSGETPGATAREYARRFGAALGLDAADALRVMAVTKGNESGSDPATATVRLQQEVGGLPVMGGELVVGMDGDGNLTSLGGEATAAGAEMPVDPVPAASARWTAARSVARHHQVEVASLRGTEPEQWLYDPALFGAEDRVGARPVWRVEVTDGFAVRDLVLVDLASGRVVARIEQVHGIERVVCNAGNVPYTTDQPGQCSTAYARTETGPESADAQVEAAFDHAGAASDLFAEVGPFDVTARLGVSTGDGVKLRSTVRVCPKGEACPMDNAFWNGTGMYYGDGYAAADDVVGHELTHGVIDETAGLSYWYQSGAINESFADVFGEIVDLRYGDDAGDKPWVVGEDVPGGAFRDMASPQLYGQPDRMTSADYAADTSYDDAGGVHTNSGVGNKAAYLIAEGGDFNGHTIVGLDADDPGKTETAAIYWRALQLLTSGSDYEDLYWALPQACRDLVGTNGDGISPADCEQVVAAVTATEMHWQPVTPDAAAPEAARCPSPSHETRTFFDNVEGSTTPWTWTGVWGPAPRSDMPYPYATSGTRSFFGWDPDPSLYQEPTESRLSRRNPFLVPGDGSTFLRFDHSYLFEWYAGSTGRQYTDGGRVQYSTDGGASWTNAAQLPWVNGPDKSLTSVSTGGSVGFGGDSHGYMSSQVDLSSLAGEQVLLRWLINGDQQGSSGDGWWLDDVEVYTCRPHAPGAPVGTEVSGGLGVVGASWQPPLWEGAGIAGYRVTATPGGATVEVSSQSRNAVLRGLDPGVSYEVAIQAFTDGGDVGAAAEHTVIGTRLALTAPATVDYGTGRLTGRLTRSDSGAGLSGQVVRIQSRPAAGGPWAQVDVVDAGSRGEFSFPVSARTHSHYRVAFDGGGARMGSRSVEALVKVRPRLTASVAAGSVARADDAWLYGRVYPTSVGETVKLQRHEGTRWRTIDSLRLEHRSYRFDLPTGRTGTYEFRALKPATDQRLSAVSPSRRIRVY